MTHARLKHRVLLTGLLLLASAAPPVCVAQAMEMSKLKQDETKTDAQVVEELAAPNYKEADAAVDEILRRGVRMIPLLMKKKGDRRHFRGFLTRDSHTSTTIFVPFGDAKKEKKLLEEGKLVTVEVAALYLITAIYHGSLRIAQSPYLTDLSLPEIKRKQANKKKLIERAWKATNEWYQRLIASDLSTLKAAKDYPLKSADVDFW